MDTVRLVLLLTLLLLAAYYPRELVNYRSFAHVFVTLVTVIPLYSMALTWAIGGGLRLRNPPPRPRKGGWRHILIPLTVAAALLSLTCIKDMPVGYDTPYYIYCIKRIVHVRLADVCGWSLLTSIFKILVSQPGGLYYLALSLPYAIGADPLMIARLLPLQGILLVVAYYLLVREITGSQGLALSSAILACAWRRMLGMIDGGLHRNIAALALGYIFISILIRFLSARERKMKLSYLVITLILFAITTFTHLMTALPLGILLILTIPPSSMRRRGFLCAVLITLAVGASAPLAERLLRLTVGDPYVAFADIFRKWWPEVPAWDLKAIGNALDPVYLLLSLFGILELTSMGNAGSGVLLLYTVLTLTYSQNFVFGTHVLPERFLNLVPVPALTALGLERIWRTLGSPRLLVEVRGRRVVVSVAWIAVILLCSAELAVRFEEAMSLWPYITAEEYGLLKKLREEILMRGLPLGSRTRLVVPRTGLEVWAAAIMPELPKRNIIVALHGRVPRLRPDYIYYIINVNFSKCHANFTVDGWSVCVYDLREG